MHTGSPMCLGLHGGHSVAMWHRTWLDYGYGWNMAPVATSLLPSWHGMRGCHHVWRHVTCCLPQLARVVPCRLSRAKKWFIWGALPDRRGRTDTGEVVSMAVSSAMLSGNAATFMQSLGCGTRAVRTVRQFRRTTQQR
jgi:hypothetical protein